MTEAETGKAELFIHLDLEGLAALMKTIEAAIESGRGRLDLCSGSGARVAGGGSSLRFEAVTVTFAAPPGPSDDAGRTGRPDPAAHVRTPVLEMQS